MVTPTHCYVLLGPPGSGKGTQAEVLAQVFLVPHVSTGDMFRTAIAASTELGQRVAGLLKAGQLVPDDATNQVVAERLKQPDASSGFVLDGYPRSLRQAVFLQSLAPEARAVLIELPDDEAVRRIAGRRTCSSCYAIYHVDFKPPRQAGVCDVCGNALVQRNDQTEAVVRDRLAVYHAQTEPLVAFYQAAGTLIRVNGLPPIPEVTAAIRAALAV